MDDTELRKIITKWLNRAEPNFADPEALESTLDYWRGVKAVCNEFLQSLKQANSE